MSKKRGNQGRGNLARDWSEDSILEDGPSVERWSREAKTEKGPKEKKDYSFEDSERGMVYVVNRRTYGIVNKSRELYQCELPPNLHLDNMVSLAVGDEVEFSTTVGKNGMISKVFPRINKISRLGPKNRRGRELILAANVDQAVVFISYENPKFNHKLLDRFLVRFGQLNIPVLICFNKSDLMEDKPGEIDYLKGLGYEIHSCSALDDSGIEPLRKSLRGKKTVLTGPSGVGKSSMLSQLCPEAEVEIGELRGKGSKGRHTTIRTECFPFEKDGWVMDTPGIRELALDWERPAEVAHLFRDLDKLSEKCRFRDCNHLLEEGCEITRSLESDLLPAYRYDSYLSIVQKGDNRGGG